MIGEGKEYVETSIEISVHALQAASPEFNASEVTSTIRAAYGCTLVDFIEGSTIVIGETLSERIQDATLGDTIAPLITVTPVLLRPHGTPREILEEYSRISLASWKHRHVLPTLVRKLLLRPHDQALYPAMFVFHPGPHNGQSEILDVIWTPMDDVVGLTVEHGLALNVYMEGDGILKLVFTADAALMLNPQLQLIAEQVVALIEAMTKFPDTPVGQLMATFPERILSIARPNVSEAVRTAHVVDPMYWMEHYAENHPDWKAAEVADTITCTGSTTRSWSYAQLNEQANRIAALIDSFNIGRNRMVSLCVPRTLEAYAPIAGVYKAGCGYLSIDEGLPAERKGLLVEDSNSAILFTTFELAETFPVLHAEVRIICIDDVKFINELATFSGANVARNVHQDDISYLLYTSGSTGKPKGVQVSRGNLSAFVESQSDFICREVPATLELGGQGNYLGLASRAFDVHVAEMFLAWRHGLAAVTADRSLLLDDIGLALAQLKITHASFVPSLLDQADLVPGDVPALRFMGVGGEKISQRVVDTWASNETVSLVNAYGPTEVTICCSSLAVSPDSTVRNIGNLLGNITGYVFVPGTFIPTKRGQPGELCITGDLVALGYYQRPDAGGFVDYNGERLYRTGDMVRLMDGDAIEYLGRSDDQAKIRGQRLELGEVSEGIRSSSKEELDVASLILQHPGLSRAQLVCFVARSAHHFVFQDKAPTFLAGDYEVFAQELQTECRKKLPAYMVPDVVIPMNIMPHAAMSGKADAKQLKALFSGIPLSELLHSTASGNNRSVAERELTADEEIIRGLIAAIVSVDAEHIVHVSNIFELGIDSLSAITLSLKMKGLGYNSSVVSVLGNPTIEGLAAIPRKSSREQNIVDRALLDARKSLEGLDARLRPQVSAIANVPESSIVVIRPCLPLQEGIIARSINSESGPIYVNHVTLKLDSKIDADKLRRAWKEAVGANDILRTLFCQPEDAFVQVVLAPDSLNYWNETSITSTEEALANFRPNEVASEIISNIHQRPPIRLHLARSDSSTSLLFISMHHSIYDGQSFLMLLDEVADRYNSVDVEERASFGSLVEHLAAQNIENAQDFWTKSLEGCRPTLVATQTGYREDEAVSIAEHTVSIRLSELEACASHLRCTLPSLSQLVFGILLAQRVGHNDVIFGSVLSGRAATVAGAETIMAPLITTNPQRVQLHSGSSTIADLVEEYQKVNIASLEHQHISLRHIQRWAGADRPLFDTLFSFVHKVSAPGDSLWEEVESSTVADYPFAIEFEADVDADCLVVRIGFTPAYGTAEEVKVVLEKIDLLLQDLSHGESMKLSCLGVSDLNADSQTTVAESFDECSWTTEETTMREVAVEVCGVPIEQVKKSSTFYSLGIDSVTAIRFARMLRKLEIPVSSADVIRFPSIGALSQQIARKASEADAPKVDVPASDIKRLLENTNLTFIDAETVEAVYSCTPLQSGMLTQTLASSDGRLYVHHHCVKLETTTDVSRLQAAWLQVIEKTDILRTVFHHSPELENAWTAVVRKVSPAKVIEEDISGTFDEALLEVAKKVIFTDEAHFQETPVQARLLRGPSDIFFVVSMHHSLYDGVSIPFVFQDLATIYAGESK